MNLIQFSSTSRRFVGLVEEPYLIPLKDFYSVYDLVSSFLEKGTGNFTSFIETYISSKKFLYDEVYQQKDDWQVLPAIDHPHDPNHCMLSGTGLTHKASAENRQKMHDSQKENTLTDSMKMYLSGIEGGKPGQGKIGISPEWFYKGNGSILKGHGDTLMIPNYGKDGGEEPEIAGIYFIDEVGMPIRIGFCTSNEFSDHVIEKENYLYLAPSKIRNCSIGPELVITEDFKNIKGRVAIHRAGKPLWQKEIKTGEENMAHSLYNLEYHHFKYSNHRVPGQVHVHFFGADAFSFGDGIRLEQGDEMEVSWDGFGRPLRNKLEVDRSSEEAFEIKSLK